MRSARLPGVAEDTPRTRSKQDWGEMGGGTRLVVSLALAAIATAGVVRPAEAPQAAFRNPAYVPDHKIILEPIMGIRGEATVLRLPVVA